MARAILWLLLQAFTAAAAASQELPATRAPQQIKATATGGAKSAPGYQLYTYYGDRYRDPFVPLVGEIRSDSGQDRPPQIGSLLLKGIIRDAKSRMALLTSGVNSYILRGGRLYDGRNRMVKGISGIVKVGSVILIGSDRTVRELKEKAAL